MAWDVNDEEFRSVLALSADRRYEYFVRRGASHGRGLGYSGARRLGHRGGRRGGTAIARSGHIPGLAEACAQGPRAGERPAAIDSKSGSRPGCRIWSGTSCTSPSSRLRTTRASVSALSD